MPRRSKMYLMVPAEIAIQEAIWKVESVGADNRLTEAVILLAKARDLISDYLDENEFNLATTSIQ